MLEVNTYYPVAPQCNTKDLLFKSIVLSVKLVRIVGRTLIFVPT